MASWLVQLLGHESARVPALKTIGNLAAGADAHAQAVVDCGLVPRLRGCWMAAAAGAAVRAPRRPTS